MTTWGPSRNGTRKSILVPAPLHERIVRIRVPGETIPQLIGRLVDYYVSAGEYRPLVHTDEEAP